MKKNFDILEKSPLFAGIDMGDYESLLSCLHARHVSFRKGEPVFLEGDPVRFVGLLLCGTAQIIREDYYGNRSVLSVLHPADLFGEIFSCAGLSVIPVSVFAQTDCQVLLLDCKAILHTCGHACAFHQKLIENLMQSIASKNLLLNQKIRYMSQKTTKEKLLSYLSDQAKQQHSNSFIIPYDRQSLADYLGVERSAMSAEISKLKKAGILNTRGSFFCLLKPIHIPS